MAIPRPVHALAAVLAFAGAGVATTVAVRLGALAFIHDNVVDGLLLDFVDGFFHQPLNFALLIGLLAPPPLLWYLKAPTSALFVACVASAFPVIVTIGIIVEVLPVLLPVGAVVGPLLVLGVAEAALALGRDLKLLQRLKGKGKRKQKLGPKKQD